MIEDFSIAELGEAEVETMQSMPGGPYSDSLYGWGWLPGLVEG